MRRPLVILISLPVLLAACGGGTSGSPPPAPVPVPVPMPVPTALVYPSPIQSTYAVAIAPVVPVVVGTVTSYSVTPALPSGLTLDATTGVISGTPLEAPVFATRYAITASNAIGSFVGYLILSVNYPSAPASLSYSSPLQAVVGTPIPTLSPTVVGSVTDYAVFPPLPNGLSLDPATGVLSGTPRTARFDVHYTITASSAEGATSFALELTVDPPPPGTVLTGVFRDSTVSGLGFRSGSQTGVTDATGAYSYEVGQSITFFVGDLTLGTVAVPKALISPTDLVPGGTGSTLAVINLARFLMMLDGDGDPSNGIQISPAVTTAAANWPAVDFTTTDLPSALAGVIAQVNSVDGVTHSLPDAAAAQAHLQATLACAYSGGFVGLYAGESLFPASTGALYLTIAPDGTVDAVARGFADGQVNEDLMPAGDFNPLSSNSLDLGEGTEGTFSDPDLVTGIDAPFWAARIGGDSAAEYRFTGSFYDDEAGDNHLGLAVLDLDSSNQLSGIVFRFDQQTALKITGSVSGTAFVASGGGMSFSGILDPATLTLYGGASGYLYTHGCRLN